MTLDPRAGPANASTAFSPPKDPSGGNGISIGDAPSRAGLPGHGDPSIPGSAKASVEVDRGRPPAADPGATADQARSGIEARDASREDPSTSDRALTESVAAAAAMASTEAEAPAEPDQAGEPARAPTRIARVVAVANQKGGVGKSTTAVSLGAALAELGNQVLVVDLDPQGNASTGMGIRHVARDVTTYEVLLAQAPIENAIVQTPVEGLSAVPSTIDLAGAEIELVSQFSRETRLTKALEPVRTDRFDYVILDCPPSLGLLTINALTAADELVVPIQCEYYALEGLGQLLRNVRLIQQNVNPELRLSGIVMTMFDARTKLSEQVVAEVRRYFGARVFDTVIPRTVRLSEAPGYGQPITLYDPMSKGAKTYRALARELADRGPDEAGVPDIALPTIIKPAERPPPEPTAPKPARQPANAAASVPSPTTVPPVAREAVEFPTEDPAAPEAEVLPEDPVEPEVEFPTQEPVELEAATTANEVGSLDETLGDEAAASASTATEEPPAAWQPVVREHAEGSAAEPVDEPSAEAIPTQAPSEEAEQGSDDAAAADSPLAEPSTQVTDAAADPGQDHVVDPPMSREGEEQAPSSSGDGSDTPPPQVEESAGSDEAPRKKFRLFRRGGEE